MAGKLSTCFLGQELVGLNSKYSNVRLSTPSHRLPTSCKVRRRNFSSQNKRQLTKKISSDRPRTDADLQINFNEGANMEKPIINIISSLNGKMKPNENIHANEPVNHTEEMNSIMLDENITDMAPAERNLPSTSSSNNCTSYMSESIASFPADEAKPSVQISACFMKDKKLLSLQGVKRQNNTSPLQPQLVWSVESLTMPLSMQALNGHGVEKMSTIQLEDMISMIKDAEKNVLLLNEARVRALEDLEKILREKEVMQSEMNLLEMKLAETDERVKVAAQEKIHVEFLKEQLERMEEWYNDGGADANKHSVNGVNNKLSVEEVHRSLGNDFHALNEEFNSLRTENSTLKDDIEVLRSQLRNVKTIDDQVMILVSDNSRLETALKGLELKLTESQGEVTELSSIKFEHKSLLEKVETLQALLDKALKQADEAILLVQQNQELHEKVGRLEESVEEANIYKLSSDKMQQYNELMHKKLKLLEERLEKSDEDIQSYFKLYQEYIQEFHDTLNRLQEESKKRSNHGPVNNIPREFWSRLLLLIDGWLLEKKLLPDDANKLRDMAWKRDRRIYDAYMACKEKNEHGAFSMLSKLTRTPMSSSALHVVHIAAEMAPVAKVGGLADVVTGLCKALQKKGHLVEIVLPKYDCMQYDDICNLRALDTVLESYFDGTLFKNNVWVGTVEGLPVYFIEPIHPSKFFWRAQYYGENDDFKRFSYFSRAALELLLQAGKKPDIIHCHDWQTAFVAPLYWDIYSQKGLNSARICFTCHNFEYQGAAPAKDLISCGLDVHQLNTPDRMQDNSCNHRVNPIKGAVVFSNIVTTVSPTYALEVQTPEGGQGLHGTLSSYAKKFVGILNGIDTDTWNPSTDKFLEVQYNSTDLCGKLENKQALRRKLGLSSTDVKQPLVGCVTRLVPQKGIHLIRHAMYRTIELGGQFVLLGSSPVHHIQKEFEGIANQFGNHNNVRLILKYDDSLAHSIYAASDMFIIPSMFEPCGLTQMIAMRYGTIPVVRKTGGLNDSVFDVDDDTIPPQFRNGFIFLNPDEQGVNSALDRAFNYYRSNEEGWMQLAQKVMNLDFSWELSASQYEELYEKSLARRRSA